ncbi:MAG: hypothetical protein K0S44_2905 [Bacteroidetes bacterium]|jgi:hypothetical protein|nr:hypothetical protein [Bacteroidota bacterium]
MKAIRTISSILFVAVGFSALTAGYIFISDPSGNSLGLSVSLLNNSPFPDYLFPGIFLFSFIGVMNLLVAILTTMNYKGHQRLIVIQSIILISWIIIEMIMIREISMLHFLIAGIGVLLFMMGNRLNV